MVFIVLLLMLRVNSLIKAIVYLSLSHGKQGALTLSSSLRIFDRLGVKHKLK